MDLFSLMWLEMSGLDMVTDMPDEIKRASSTNEFILFWNNSNCDVVVDIRRENPSVEGVR